MSVTFGRISSVKLTFLKCRHLVRLPYQLFSTKPPDQDDGHKKFTSTEVEDQEDSALKKTFGSSENKGRGEPVRPIFFPPPETEKGALVGTDTSRPQYKPDDGDLSPPTNCCMSGCPTCVWIEYVERLTKVYTDPSLSREKVHADIENIPDENIKAFLIMELRFRGLW